MGSLIEVLKLVVEKGPEVISAVVALLSGAIAIALLIPGDQPEKALQNIVNLLTKISKK